MLAEIIKVMVAAGASAELIAAVSGVVLTGAVTPAPKTARQIINARHYQKRKARLNSSEPEVLNGSENVLNATPLIEDSSLPLESKPIYINHSKSEKDDGFAEFVEAFPKRPDGAGSPRATREAYAAALSAGALPAALTAQARAYAAQRAATIAKDARQAAFTLTAASWLDRGLWRSPKIALAPSPSHAGQHVTRDDPRWPQFAQRYRAAKGCEPPIDRLNGWWFAAEMTG